MSALINGAQISIDGGQSKSFKCVIMINNVESNFPYLSIVIPFRNDNYTLNAIEKLNF